MTKKELRQKARQLRNELKQVIIDNCADAVFLNKIPYFKFKMPSVIIFKCSEGVYFFPLHQLDKMSLKVFSSTAVHNRLLSIKHIVDPVAREEEMDKFSYTLRRNRAFYQHLNMVIMGHVNSFFSLEGIEVKSINNESSSFADALDAHFSKKVNKCIQSKRTSKKVS